MTSRDHVKEDLGGFVLGALDAPEADRVRWHLARCEECRREHDRLATVAPALAVLEHPHDQPAPLSPALETEVMRRLAAERRRRARPSRSTRRGAWPALGGALAGCAATLVVLAIGGAFSGERAPVRSVTLSSQDSPARASARLRTTGSGTQVRLQARGLPPTSRGELYEVWLVRGGGRVSAGTFTVPAGDLVSVTLTTAARPDAYDRIGVTREPDAADPARNGPNVLAGELSGA